MMMGTNYTGGYSPCTTAAERKRGSAQPQERGAQARQRAASREGGVAASSRKCERSLTAGGVANGWTVDGHRPPLQLDWRFQRCAFLLTRSAQTAYISFDPKFSEGTSGQEGKIADEERSMDSKKASRRKFLKGGAAAAAVGAIQSASAQTRPAAKR